LIWRQFDSMKSHMQQTAFSFGWLACLIFPNSFKKPFTFSNSKRTGLKSLLKNAKVS